MPSEKSKLWAIAQVARDKLAKRLLDHPRVSLIDIGYEPEGEGTPGRIVLRVHLRQPAAGQTPEIPEEIDGIPVRAVSGDYHPD